MAFDFKKEYKELYMPKDKPGIVTVPSMHYVAVRGSGGWGIQAVYRIAVWNFLYDQNEQEGRASDRGILRLCRTAAGRFLVAV